MKSVLCVITGLLFACSAALAEDYHTGELPENVFDGMPDGGEDRHRETVIHDRNTFGGRPDSNGRTTWRDDEGRISTSRTDSNGRTKITHGDGTLTTCRTKSTGRVSCY